MTTATITHQDARTLTESSASALLRRITSTDTSLAGFVLRLFLAVVIFPHGAQKVLGWFGGYGLAGSLGFFTDTLGIPLVLALLVFAAEFLGPIGLVVGAFSRVTAFGLIAVMVGAVLMSHLEHGFFMNWYGGQAGEGFEYHLLVIGISAALLAGGSGHWSFDRWLSRRV
jgi:putative oxidoreductase